ncbi:S-adenosyl-L-methionine-dependent methyltransferase [Glarea lozoyensis ATCC 20868]|uniref:tRNA (uracil(54)-C(5))-methyltransferase n=1 Tax=Glarea lozoyensis (strain ATCC 20868 / MF5171) TaxID=1116229 RepID=S3CN74_GLAL2|nr:S-adenosyl-L-methionine-dependent methyltransferase [Glarea lozoyensis ATCC 20868]EPE26644.1 S-adenosyl-L-methionine-dependent methyltransferase [Glarea lozoyensis ATCC 20868]
MDSARPTDQDKKRQHQGRQGQPWGKRQRTKKEKPVKEGSNDEVLIADIRALLAAQKLSDATSVIDTTAEKTGDPPAGSDILAAESSVVETKDNGQEEVVEGKKTPLPAPFSEIEVTVQEISSTGDGLATHSSSNQIYVVPFTAPGDVVKVKVIKHFEKERYSLTDFLSVVTPGPLRDDSRINCKYFSKCGGCQFQMMDYSEQLKHKKRIVEKAFKNFSELSPKLVPTIRDTIGSPLQYGYRTKLTPHFDGPPGHLSKQDKRNGVRNFFTEPPPIGFMLKGQRKTLDIEDCPIGTDAVRMGMKRERANVVKNLKTYKKGVTILLRESTERVQNDDEKASTTPDDSIKVQGPKHTDFKTCITDNNATSTEYIDDFVFTNTAGAFFQNNNSILPDFTQYIRENILPPPSPTAPAIKYFIDAYSGSGLFTITLSSLFKTSVGIDIAEPSIVSARQNAALNNLPPEQCKFIAADAPKLFNSIQYPKDETVVVLDPPRKGCDESFLNQLLNFAPRRVVYVSCNVHTQARDVGVLVRGMKGSKTRYEIESLRGFDFFPQTGHVEGVAVLNRVEVDTSTSATIPEPSSSKAGVDSTETVDVLVEQQPVENQTAAT